MYVCKDAKIKFRAHPPTQFNSEGRKQLECHAFCVILMEYDKDGGYKINCGQDRSRERNENEREHSLKQRRKSHKSFWDVPESFPVSALQTFLGRQLYEHHMLRTSKERESLSSSSNPYVRRPSFWLPKTNLNESYQKVHLSPLMLNVLSNDYYYYFYYF
jgi:hypothetical protein